MDEFGEIPTAVVNPSLNIETNLAPLTPEARTFGTVLDSMQTEQTPLFERARKMGDLQSWGAVMIGAKPAETADLETNRWFLGKLEETSPEVAGQFALLEPVVPEKTDPNPSRNTESWFVNKDRALEVVNNNSDFFGVTEPLINFDQARKAIAEKLADPNLVDITYGLMYGYPKADCEGWNNLKPIMSELGGYPDSVGHLKELGFSDKESRFINKFAFDGPQFLRRLAVRIMSKHIVMTLDQHDAILGRVLWQDKFRTLSWVGIKSNQDEAVATIKAVDEKVSQSGLDKVLIRFNTTR